MEELDNSFLNSLSFEEKREVLDLMGLRQEKRF
jgi:hypothetical protein